jgi:uncharacterized membrane protein YkvA (DUF1232 family)
MKEGVAIEADSTGPGPNDAAYRVKMLATWEQRAKALKREVYTLYFACRDPRVPWYAKALGAVIVGYVFSPIDLIPDFIPVLGYLDELVLVPFGVMAVRAMVSGPVLDECRERAARLEGRPMNRLAAVLIVAIWLSLAAAAIYWISN